MLSTILKHVNIEDLPSKFGGEFDYQHGMQPSLDPAIIEKLTWLPPNVSLPMGRMNWIRDANGRRTAVAIRSDYRRELYEKVATLPSCKGGSMDSQRSRRSRESR